MLTKKTKDPFFTDLVALMRTDEFQRFYRTHMATNLDLKTSVVYIELWNNIETIFKQCTGNDISDDAMEMVLRESFRRQEYRRPLTRLVQSYLNNDLSRKALDKNIQTFFHQQMVLNDDTMLLESDKDKKI